MLASAAFFVRKNDAFHTREIRHTFARIQIYPLIEISFISRLVAIEGMGLSHRLILLIWTDGEYRLIERGEGIAGEHSGLDVRTAVECDRACELDCSI